MLKNIIEESDIDEDIEVESVVSHPVELEYNEDSDGYIHIT